MQFLIRKRSGSIYVLRCARMQPDTSSIRAELLVMDLHLSAQKHKGSPATGQLMGRSAEQVKGTTLKKTKRYQTLVSVQTYRHSHHSHIVTTAPAGVDVAVVVRQHGEPEGVRVSIWLGNPRPRRKTLAVPGGLLGSGAVDPFDTCPPGLSRELVGQLSVTVSLNFHFSAEWSLRH